MSIKTHQQDPIAAARRKSVSTRRVGIGAQCACGEDRPLALIAGSNPVICAECKRQKVGRAKCDQHHVAGKANHPVTIPVPANDHRAVLSEEQYKWPKATLQNSDGNLLLAIAGCIRGFYDTVVYLLQKLLLWIPERLEALNVCLTAQFGPQWWTIKAFTEFTKRSS
jgi:hypothetical protein